MDWEPATGESEDAHCGDQRRAGGLHANAAMRLDPVLKNTGLVDTVGGSAVFYQSQVKLIRVSA